MPQFSHHRSHSPNMHLLSSALPMPHTTTSSATPTLYRPSLSASPKREAYSSLMPMTHHSMDLSPSPRSPQPASNDTKLPSIGQLLLTPPNSTEMSKEHSFPAYHEDHGSVDHALFPLQRRPPSRGSQDFILPLFSPPPPPPRLQHSYQNASRSEAERRPSGATLATLNSPARRDSDPRLQKYITTHQTQFQNMHPGSSAPKEEHYQLFVDFLGEMRTRQSPASPPQPPAAVLQETSSNRSGGRHTTPQYGPYFPTSPAKRSSPTPRHMSEPDIVAEQAPDRVDSPIKRRRVGSETSESLEPELSPQLSRRRRSAQPSRKRGSHGGGVLKEAKHNRNRSTKEKKSSNYEDYADLAPALETMQNPMEAARRVPEHKVNTRKDLSADPLREQLHEAEVMVAQRLNIGCSEYLVFKRQVFQVYVHYLKDPASSRGQWNKTRAQQAGNLDVGKASQIWVFWKSIGWFREELFTEHV